MNFADSLPQFRRPFAAISSTARLVLKHQRLNIQPHAHDRVFISPVGPWIEGRSSRNLYRSNKAAVEWSACRGINFGIHDAIGIKKMVLNIFLRQLRRAVATPFTTNRGIGKLPEIIRFYIHHNTNAF